MHLFQIIVIVFAVYFYGAILAIPVLKTFDWPENVAVLRAFWWPLIVLRWIIVSLIKCTRIFILWSISTIGDFFVEGWFILRGK